ncbi:MAG: NAD(P)-dependent oxidoreductase [Spirochaetales bacterium]|nr:NAD(P)-dependent oxidoreductase [Spirochaetales bacterium]
MIAFFGMGLLGSNFVRALRRRGEEVHVWNRTPERAFALKDVGAKPFNNAADAVRGASRLHLTLPDDAIVDAVLKSAEPGFSAGLVIIDHSTVSTEGARRRALDWAEKGFHYLHAPVFMGPQNALDSTGLMLVGGPRELFSRVEKELEKMTGAIKYVGADTSRAAALKLIGNSFILTLTTGLRDILLLAKSMGIEHDDVTSLFDSIHAGDMVPVRLKKLLTMDFSQPTWELQMARKDAGLMINEAKNAGLSLSVLPVLTQMMDVLIQNGQAQKDWTIVAQDALQVSSANR